MIHEHSVHGRVNAWQPILDRGGALIGEVAYESSTTPGRAKRPMVRGVNYPTLA